MHKYTIISDIHLGMNESNPKIVLNFLKSIETETLILNGDIIDVMALRRGSKWTKHHSLVVSELLKLSKKTKIIYLRGNHDDEVKNLFNIKMKNIEIRENYILEFNNKKYLTLHGDIFDPNIIKNKTLYTIGSIGYDIMLKVNKYYNILRYKFGLPYKSISKPLKKNFKSILSLISDFELNAANEAVLAGCDGVICGHIHTPSNKILNGIHYLNSGDWVENFSYIIMDEKNGIEIIHYKYL